MIHNLFTAIIHVSHSINNISLFFKHTIRHPGYWREGFLSLQHNIDIAIIKQLNLTAYGDKVKASKPSLDDIKLKVKRFPYPSYIDDNFVLVIQQQLPLILMLSFVYSALSIVKDVVHEKERKLKVCLTLKFFPQSNYLINLVSDFMKNQTYLVSIIYDMLAHL